MKIKCDNVKCKYNSYKECTRKEVHISNFTYYDMSPYDISKSTCCASFEKRIPFDRT